MALPGFGICVATVYDEANQCHRHMSRELALLLDFYGIAARGGSFHPPEDRERVLTIVLEMLAHYSWLSKWAETTGARRRDTVLEHRTQDIWHCKHSGST